MWNAIVSYFWTRFEPTRDERINAAEELLEGTGLHVHRNPIKARPEPLFEKPRVLGEGRFKD